MMIALPTRLASLHALMWALALVMASTGAAHAATATPLAAASYAVLPTPQRVALSGGEFSISNAWRVRVAPGIPASDIAIETLTDELAVRHGLRLSPADQDATKTIELVIRADAVALGPALDRDRDVLAKEAYQIDLGEQNIRITANAEAGLFYGVETLSQLIKHRNGGLWLPAGGITDWPDLQLRSLYWDDAHHLERFDALKRAIRTAAFFKMNGFVLKLDGHFQYKSAPAVVEPYALTPGEYQALTDYGLRYHVQVIPYLDAPAHIAFILKHPDYAGLRAFADCNYELNVVNPESCAVLFGMYQDLIAANKGGRYFYLSTDEAYYVGLSADPKRRSDAGTGAGRPGKVLGCSCTRPVGSCTNAAAPCVLGRISDETGGRAGVPGFPGERQRNPEFDAAFKAWNPPAVLRVHWGRRAALSRYAGAPATKCSTDPNDAPRVAQRSPRSSGISARRNADLLGAVVAGWANSGLHPETFWLGY